MINCLFIKITHNARGLPVRSYRTITAEELTFGRGAECTVHLQDPRIAMHHAVIRRENDGQIHIVAINGELELELSLQQSLVLTQGIQVMIGPYQLTVEPAPPDVDLVVSLALAQQLPDDFENIKSRTHEPLPNAVVFKRRLSLWMAALIILLFIGLPLAQNLIPQWREAIAEWPYGFDRAWSPGRISTSHRHFGSQCINCHQVPLKKVSDQACTTCHQTTPAHIADPALQKRALKAAHRFIGSMRCAECHQEHKAPHPLARQDNQMCIKCHGDIKKIDPDTSLPDVSDFELNHPDFKLSFKTGPQFNQIERISQEEKSRLVEKSGLIFPHSQHIGKVQGPNGMMDVREMSCTTCHQSADKQMRFTALSFKRDCLTCHASQLNVGSGKDKLTVPHGDEQNVFNALKLYAPKEFERHSETLKSTGCAYCHDIIESDKPGSLTWRVKPLLINADWFSKAQFKHASHRTQQCTSCHKVEESESSADVAMPDRKSCLSCHSGNSTKHKRIASGCMTCHDFHNAHQMSGNLINNTKLDEKEVDALLSSLNKADEKSE